MSEPLISSGSKEEWDRFFELDNQEALLDAVSPDQSKGTDFESTSPSIPSLDFNSHSTGNSSPSELGTFVTQFSPVYQISPSPIHDSAPTLVAPNPKKRKVATDHAATAAQGTGRQPRGQKISHNVIEKRYRSNLNDKIARLRDSVPELRAAVPTVKRKPAKPSASESEGSGDEGSHGLKFNKATVLTKATEYIQQLEKQNQRLQSELSRVRNRGGLVEKLRNPPAISTSISHEQSSPSSTEIPSVTVTSTDEGLTQADPATTVNGMIKVPEDVRRLRESAQQGDHYASSITGDHAPTVATEDEQNAFKQPIKGLIPIPDDVRRLREQAVAQAHFSPESSFYNSRSFPEQEIFIEDDSEGSAWPRSKALSRVLVGSLAGLMIMEGLSEPDRPSSEREKRGLFSLPTELVTESRGFRAQIRQRIIHFMVSPAASKVLPLIFLSVLFFVLCLSIFVWLAPRESKAVREGPEPVAPRQSRGPNTAEVSTSVEQQRAYSPPPNTSLETSQKKSWDFAVVDRLAGEWFGISLTGSRRLDEEAFWRPTGRLWTGLRGLLPQLLYERKQS